MRECVTQPDSQTAPRQSLRFLWLYALAIAGGSVSYAPFLTLLLPLRAQAMAGEEAVSLLAYAAFAGAIAASLANIGFGWLSDVTGRRKIWVWSGMVLSGALLMAMPRADTPGQLLALIVAWQIAVNMMLGPLFAWAGDVVPDRQKGLLGGLMSFAPALGALSGAFVTIPGLADADARLALVALLVAAMVSPVLLLGRPRPMPQLRADAPDPATALPTAPAPHSRNTLIRMWCARLLVQIAEAALFAYLLVWISGLAPGFGDDDVARMLAIVLGLSVPLAMVTGRWSDRHHRPIMPLALAAALIGGGLVVMAMAPSLGWAIAGYVLFGLASGVFLALHSSQTLRVLRHPSRRGRDLGIFNLTNTVPSLIMPWLTLALVPLFGFSGLFWVLAGLAGCAALLLATVSTRNS